MANEKYLKQGLRDRIVRVSINPDQWKLLRQISRDLGTPISTLIQQEIDLAMTNAEVWIQRAAMIHVI